MTLPEEPPALDVNDVRVKPAMFFWRDQNGTPVEGAPYSDDLAYAEAIEICKGEVLNFELRSEVEPAVAEISYSTDEAPPKYGDEASAILLPDQTWEARNGRGVWRATWDPAGTQATWALLYIEYTASSDLDRAQGIFAYSSSWVVRFI